MIELIKRISDKAGVSQEVAEKTFDVVVAEVKSKLPKGLADDLVKVMAGEKSFLEADDDNQNAQTGYTKFKKGYLQGWKKLKSSVESKK